MENFRPLSAAEQVAAKLKSALVQGRWTGVMPGEQRLKSELGVGTNTVRAALDLLEDERFLAPQGVGKRRLITLPESSPPPVKRVGILLYENKDQILPPFAEIRHEAVHRGHAMNFSEKSLTDLRMDPQRIAAFIRKQPADMWVVVAAPRRVLEWFAAQPAPTLAIYGVMNGVPIAGAGVDLESIMGDLIERLLGMGHRRIVNFVRKEHRRSRKASSTLKFINVLTAHGIKLSNYHLPDWEETPEGLAWRLDELFRHTPPTTLIFDEPFLLLAAQQHLARKGILAPRDYSLIGQQPDPTFDWSLPRVSHTSWSHEGIVRRAMRWIDNVSHGREDLRQVRVKARPIAGGTIGPPLGQRL